MINLNDLYYSYYRYYFFREKEYYRDYLNLSKIINDAINNISYPNRDDILGFYYYIKYNNHMAPKMMHLCITDFCQLRCKHCYFGKDERLLNMSPENVNTIFNKFFQIREFFIKHKYEHISCPSLNIAGGEPMVHPNLLSIIDIIPKNKFFFIKFVTNGYEYNKEVINRLLTKGCKIVYQISLDGTKDTHNFIRGNNSYDNVIKTITSIRRDFPDLHIQIAYNAHHDNYKDVIPTVELVKNYKVNNIFFDRYVPYWNSGLKRLTTDEFKQFITFIYEAREKFNDETFEVNTARSMQNNRYVCHASIEHNIIKSDGTRNTCTRYLLENGNFYTDTVEELIEKSIKTDIKVKKIPTLCRNCRNLPICKGGMRCLTYAVKNSFCEPDINCYNFIGE